MPRSQTVRHELIGLAGVVERNVYLVKRYFLWDVAFLLWTIANTLTIVFIAQRRRRAAGGAERSSRRSSCIGGVIWAYLGIIFEIVTETVAWERWEGTIEYTFMAPLSRPVHLFGMGVFAVLYGVVRASILFVAVVAFFGIHLAERELPRRARAARDRVDLVHRDRDDDGRPAADLAREGHAARVHRAGDDARRLGRLLLGRGPAGVDAVDLEDLAGDLRAARHPRRDPRRRRRSPGATSGRCS